MKVSIYWVILFSEAQQLLHFSGYPKLWKTKKEANVHLRKLQEHPRLFSNARVAKVEMRIFPL